MYEISANFRNFVMGGLGILLVCSSVTNNHSEVTKVFFPMSTPPTPFICLSFLCPRVPLFYSSRTALLLHVMQLHSEDNQLCVE